MSQELQQPEAGSELPHLTEVPMSSAWPPGPPWKQASPKPASFAHPGPSLRSSCVLGGRSGFFFLLSLGPLWLQVPWGLMPWSASACDSHLGGWVLTPTSCPLSLPWHVQFPRSGKPFPAPLPASLRLPCQTQPTTNRPAQGGGLQAAERGAGEQQQGSGSLQPPECPTRPPG